MVSRLILRKDFSSHDECWRKARDNCSATIFSSPGCSMNEHMDNPERPSPQPIIMAGLEFRSDFETSWGVAEIRESQLICI